MDLPCRQYPTFSPPRQYPTHFARSHRPADRSTAPGEDYRPGRTMPSIHTSKPDKMPGPEWRNPMKALILAALLSLAIGAGTSFANDETLAYQAPAHNYYQNNWMNG